MAFFVRRRDGRYELRESIHTARGPRARTLVNFAVLTEEVLDRASGRAQRSLDREDVWDKAGRKGVPLGPRGAAEAPSLPMDYGRFVETSRRLGASFDRAPPRRPDPGQALVELAGLVDAVASPGRRGPILEYPVLARLRG
jgi:hypothetical protein